MVCTVDPDTGHLEITHSLVNAGGTSSAISADGRNFYVGHSNYLSVYRRDEDTGELTLIQTTVKPPDDPIEWVSGIDVSPTGRFVYAAKSDLVIVFERNPLTGKLGLPMNSGVTGGWNWDVVSGGGSDVLFIGTDAGVAMAHTNEDTGELSPAGFAPYPDDAWRLALSPDGKHLYVTNPTVNSIMVLNTSYTSPVRMPLATWPLLGLLPLAGVAVLRRKR